MARILFLVLLACCAHPLFACSCNPPPSVAQTRSLSEAVFTGVVESIGEPIDAPRGGEPYFELRKITFRVMQWWKYERLDEEVEVWTGRGGGDCGYPFQKGRAYLVYAQRSHVTEQLVTGICGRTASLICALDEVEGLGPPEKTLRSADLDTLIAREQPYAVYWTPCIDPAVLFGERGLQMDKRCQFRVSAVIDREGLVRDLEILARPNRPLICPDSLEEQLRTRVADWRFRPASIAGKPVEVLLQTISLREPMTEKEYAAQLEEMERHRERMKKAKPVE